jgi:hypothetical protein
MHSYYFSSFLRYILPLYNHTFYQKYRAKPRKQLGHFSSQNQSKVNVILLAHQL